MPDTQQCCESARGEAWPVASTVPLPLPRAIAVAITIGKLAHAHWALSLHIRPT